MSKAKQLAKIIVVQGPTSSGKSDLAIQLAREFDGEIISADSRQIYRGMDLGTGKVPKDPPLAPDTNHEFFSEGVRHHLIDIIDPETEFNVSHFKTEAEKIIQEILQRGKLPIICGGTNFWIDALLNNTVLPAVAPNPQLRSLLRNESATKLFAKLQKLDPARAENIDPHNKVRLIRAIEICQALGKIPRTQNPNGAPSGQKYNALQLALEVPREILNTKIKLRLEQRFEQGMLEEVKKLLENGVSSQWLERIGLEYRWLNRFLQGEIDKQTMLDKLYFDSIHYAKRQLTWLKKNSQIQWLASPTAAVPLVKNFLQQ